jgi:hypothetical protein
MNGWTFRPDDFPNFSAKQNRRTGSAEQGCGFHRLCAASYQACWTLRTGWRIMR